MKAAALALLVILGLGGCLPSLDLNPQEASPDPVYLAEPQAVVAAIVEAATDFAPTPDYSPFVVTGRAAGRVSLSASSSGGDSTFLSFTLTNSDGRTTLTSRSGGRGARQAVARVLAELDARFERVP